MDWADTLTKKQCVFGPIDSSGKSLACVARVCRSGLQDLERFLVHGLINDRAIAVAVAGFGPG